MMYFFAVTLPYFAFLLGSGTSSVPLGTTLLLFGLGVVLSVLFFVVSFLSHGSAPVV